MVAMWSILIDMPERGTSSTMGWLNILATNTGSRHRLTGRLQSSSNLPQSSSRLFLLQHLLMNVTS